MSPGSTERRDAAPVALPGEDTDPGTRRATPSDAGWVVWWSVRRGAESRSFRMSEIFALRSAPAVDGFGVTNMEGLLYKLLGGHHRLRFAAVVAGLPSDFKTSAIPARRLRGLGHTRRLGIPLVHDVHLPRPCDSRPRVCFVAARRVAPLHTLRRSNRVRPGHLSVAHPRSATDRR